MRVLLIIGKGGVGKTTVAAATALSLRRREVVGARLAGGGLWVRFGERDG